MATEAAKTPVKPLTAAASRTPTKPLAPAASRTPTKPLAPGAAATKTPTKPAAPAVRGGVKTPAKSPCSSRARSSYTSENSHPNIPGSPPPPSKPTKSPEAAISKLSSAKKKTSTPAPGLPPPPRQRERRFLVAKKGARRKRSVGSLDSGSGGGFDFDKCREAAREALRASQEEFFRKERAASSTAAGENFHPEGEGDEEEKVSQEEDTKGGALEAVQEESEAELEGSSKVRAMRTKAMAKAMTSVPDPGCGRVMHLVQAFENLRTISGATSDADRAGEDSWALPGLQPWKEECTGNDDRLSWDSRTSAGGRWTRRNSSESLRSRTSAGGRRSRRNSSDSLRSSCNKMLKVTNPHPFKLRTEQRGRTKEQQFVQKVQEMLMEEEKKRIHIAQGLPWTTDEPECPLKPPVKERTEPLDIVLHSDVRAVERAEFDQYVFERNMYAEQMRRERERQKELEEEERIRQLRKELVPKAQPMPYFDRPFVPKRSAKPATIAVEPKFHLRPEKMSW